MKRSRFLAIVVPVFTTACIGLRGPRGVWSAGQPLLEGRREGRAASDLRLATERLRRRRKAARDRRRERQARARERRRQREARARERRRRREARARERRGRLGIGDL